MHDLLLVNHTISYSFPLSVTICFYLLNLILPSSKPRVVDLKEVTYWAVCPQWSSLKSLKSTSTPLSLSYQKWPRSPALSQPPHSSPLGINPFKCRFEALGTASLRKHLYAKWGLFCQDRQNKVLASQLSMIAVARFDMHLYSGLVVFASFFSCLSFSGGSLRPGVQDSCLLKTKPAKQCCDQEPSSSFG